jgi:hypothetical protein
MISGKGGITLFTGSHIIEQGGLGQDSAALLDGAGREIMWLSLEQFDQDPLDAWRAQPLEMLRRVRRNLSASGEALVGLLGVGGLCLAALGLFGRPWDHRRRLAEGFWLLSVVPCAGLLSFHIEARYLAPLAAFGLLWVARGVLHLAGWAAGLGSEAGNPNSRASQAPRTTGGAPRHEAVWTMMAVGVALLLGLLGQPAAALAGRQGMKPSHQVAALWLAAHSAPGEHVMARNSEVGLYADRPLVAFPDAEWEKVAAYGSARHARYLVVDTWEITRLRPQLAVLLDPAHAPPELEHLAEFADGTVTTLVYRWRE